MYGNVAAMIVWCLSLLSGLTVALPWIFYSHKQAVYWIFWINLSHKTNHLVSIVTKWIHSVIL